MDVPGRMLNMALVNLGCEDPNLRLSAYNLLYSLCISFRFSAANQLVFAKDMCVPYNDADFIVNISKAIATSEVHLTLEFLSECVLGFNRSNAEPVRQLLTLEYIVPWLNNLALFTHGNNLKDIHKVKELIRSLITLTAEKPKVFYISILQIHSSNIIPFCSYMNKSNERYGKCWVRCTKYII